MSIRVLINGASGRMGQEAVKAIENDTALTLVATPKHKENLTEAIHNSQAQVVVDFTVASCAYENTRAIIEAGAHPVIGTSGLLPEQITELQALCADKQLGGIIAPNFSIGAVLMMKFASDAAKYLPHAEIIELHHDKKQDAPSGTAVKTAKMIADNKTDRPSLPTCKEILPHARGANLENIAIHSIRLPGLVAHQEVLFGGVSETLSIRHDSLHRESFMPGVCLACKKVIEQNQLLYGLEHII